MARVVWCLAVDRNKNPMGNLFKVVLDDDDDVADLKRQIKAKNLTRVPTDDLELIIWRYMDPEIALHDDIDTVSEDHIKNLFLEKEVERLGESEEIGVLDIKEQETLFVEVTDVDYAAASALVPLRTLYNFLWEGGESALDRISEIKSIDVPPLDNDDIETSRFDAKFFDLQKIPGYTGVWFLSTQFYVRKEYEELDRYVDETRKETAFYKWKNRHILLLGQPGIGKTVYLTYCLIRRLAYGKPTCYFQGPKTRYLFASDGVHVVPQRMERMLEKAEEAVHKDTLTLFDLNSEHEKITTADTHVWTTLVAAFPRISRYRQWARDEPKVFMMSPWSWDEICAGRILATHRDHNIDDGSWNWKDAYLRYGGSARHLFGFATQEQLDIRISDAIAATNLNTLVKTFDFVDNHRHNLIMLEPSVENGIIYRSMDQSRFVSPYVAMRVWTKYAEANQSAAFTIYASVLFSYSMFRGTASYAFEKIGHRYVRDAMRCPIHVYQLLPTSYGPTHALHLRYINNHSSFPGCTLPSVDDIWENSYHQPDNINFPIIDSFVLEKEMEKVTGIVLFQFTVNDTHSINMENLKKWWKANPVSHKWNWRLVFVVPIDRAPEEEWTSTLQPHPVRFQSKAQQVTGAIDGMNLEQYVWPISIPALQEFLLHNP